MNVLVVSSKYPPEYAGSGLRAHNTYKRLQSKFCINFKVLTSSVITNKSREYEWEGVQIKLIANKVGNSKELNDSDNFLTGLAKRIYNKLNVLINFLFEALPAFIYLTRNHNRFDLIHVFGNVTVTSAAITYAKIIKKPIIIELVNLVQNPHYYEPKLVSLLFGRDFPKHALIVAISDHLRKACINLGYADEQIWCRPNPVDETKFFYESNRRKKNRRELYINVKTDVLLIYLAKFQPLKNQLFMVDVMSYLPINYKLILAGPLVKSGPLLQRDHAYFESILYTIRLKNLEARIEVLPKFIENPEKYIKAADVFIMPTTREAFGTPVYEAIACGVPVVVNDIPGVFDQWIQNGVNGYACRLEHQEWAKKIQLAAKINPVTMKRASEEILKVASTEVIDKEYYKRLQMVVNSY